MKKNVLLSILVFLIAFIYPFLASAQVISTFAGVGLGDDSLATKSELAEPDAVTMDKNGNIFIAQQSIALVRKISSSGIITTFAGNGVRGYSGDGGPATLAKIDAISGIAVDTAGNVYIADPNLSVIRKINAAGIISTFAGTGTSGYTGDGGPATAAQLGAPLDVFVDPGGNVLFTDLVDNVVRKVNTAGIISTIVGDGYTGTTGNGGPATAAELGSPIRLAMDKNGNLYVSETGGYCICKVDTGGILRIIFDTTLTTTTGADGDGGPALAATVTDISGMVVDTSGHLYFADLDNSRIRVIDLNTGIVSPYAGTGIAGYSGDGGAASGAQFSYPLGMFYAPAGELLLCDGDNNRVRKIDRTGIVSTIAGQNGLFGEGYAAANSELCYPTNVAFDAAGNLYFSDYVNNRIRKIDATTSAVTTVAGSGIAGSNNNIGGDGGPATSAIVYTPFSLTVDNSGNIYIADAANYCVRKVTPAGIITTIAGNGTAGSIGDHGPATAAELDYPVDVAVDNAGNVYIADIRNCAIRKVDNSGIITTIAGGGSAAYGGDGGPAALARLAYPYDVTTDAAGNIYITDNGNQRIRKIDASGIITTVAGNGSPGYSGDGGPATSAQVMNPGGLSVDAAGNIYLADFGNNVVRHINTSGVISTIAGNNTEGFSGDGGPATAARLNQPNGLAVSPSGMLYIADYGNHRIRQVTLPFLSTPTIHSMFNIVRVFPNPAQDNLTVENASNGKVVVSDMMGRELINTNINSQKQTFSLASLVPGTYLVSISVQNKTRTFKIVKQ